MRPDLIECKRVPKHTIFHYLLDRPGIPDIPQRVLAEDQDIGNLSWLDGAEVCLHSQRIRAMQGSCAQNLVILHPATCVRPHFQLVLDAFDITMRADADHPTHVGDTFKQAHIVLSTTG